MIAAAVILSLVAAPTVVTAVGEVEQLDQTKKELAAIRQRLVEKKRDAASVRADVRALDTQITELNRQIQTGEHDISELESEIRTHEARIGELTQQYETARHASVNRARELYKAGPIQSVMQLLEAEDLGEFIRMAVWWEVAAELDGEVMLRASRLKADLEDRKKALTNIRDDLARQRQWLAQRRDLIAAARADRASALNSINAQIAQEERHIRELERDSQRLTAILYGRLSRATGEVSRSGFIWPLRGRITSPYGYRRGGFHTGIDIDGNYGNPIVASKNGWVVGVNCGRGYGICTLIDHGNGVSTLYAHMSSKAVYSGTVGRGQVIGYVGCTGWCSGAHLHFEVRVNGEPRNPMHFLP